MARRGPWNRTVHWFDRHLVGAFMAAAAFVTERAVVSRSRNKTRARAPG